MAKHLDAGALRCERPATLSSFQSCTRGAERRFCEYTLRVVDAGVEPAVRVWMYFGGTTVSEWTGHPVAAVELGCFVPIARTEDCGTHSGGINIGAFDGGVQTWVFASPVWPPTGDVEALQRAFRAFRQAWLDAGVSAPFVPGVRGG